MSTIKLVVKSRGGRELLPDGLLLPTNVRPDGRSPGCPAVAVLRCHHLAQPLLHTPLSAAFSQSQATVDDLKARFAELKPYFYPSRQRFTLPPREGARSGEALVSGKRLSDYGLEDGAVVVFKDLGPQVG